MTYAEFEQLLAVYGSDRTRWPVEARKEAARLVAVNGDARSLLAETEALDRVLDHAPLPPLSREAVLSARIMDAARRSPRVVASRSAPVAAASDNAPIAQRLRAATGRSLRFAGSRAGLGAALSAASLLAGLLIGLNNPGQYSSQSWFRPVQQISAALTGTSSTVLGQYDPLDEDTL